MISKMFYAILLCCSVALVQAAANNAEMAADNPEMPEIVEANDVKFQDFFNIGSLSSKSNELILWRADFKAMQMVIHTITGHAPFIKSLKSTAENKKEDEDQSETIDTFIRRAGKAYASNQSKREYIKRLTHIDTMLKTVKEYNENDYGFVCIKSDEFISCPSIAHKAAITLKEFPSNGKEALSIPDLEELLKENNYRGAYVIVDQEKSKQFFKELRQVTTSDSTGWRAVELPQKTLFQQALQLLD